MCHVIFFPNRPGLTSHTTAIQPPSLNQWYIPIGKQWYCCVPPPKEDGRGRDLLGPLQDTPQSLPADGRADSPADWDALFWVRTRGRWRSMFPGSTREGGSAPSWSSRVPCDDPNSGRWLDVRPESGSGSPPVTVAGIPDMFYHAANYRRTTNKWKM